MKSAAGTLLKEIEGLNFGVDSCRLSTRHLYE